MPRFVVEIFEGDLVWLAYFSGVAQGSGNTPASDSLLGILNRLQQIDEDSVEDFAVDDIIADDAPSDSAIERVPDPAFMPPPADAPVNSQDAFGAGPPPAR